MFIWLADGGCGNGKAIFHNSVFVLCLPIKISLSFLYICKFSLTKITRQLSSHNCAIDNKFHVFNDGNMWAIHPAIEMYLIASFALVDQKYNYWRFLIVPIYIGPPRFDRIGIRLVWLEYAFRSSYFVNTFVASFFRSELYCVRWSSLSATVIIRSTQCNCLVDLNFCLSRVRCHLLVASDTLMKRRTLALVNPVHDLKIRYQWLYTMLNHTD